MYWDWGFFSRQKMNGLHLVFKASPNSHRFSLVSLYSEVSFFAIHGEPQTASKPKTFSVFDPIMA